MTRSSIRVKVTATGAGTAVVSGVASRGGSRLACAATKTFTGAGSAYLTCIPGPRVQALRLTGSVRVAMRLRFRPTTGGVQQTTLGAVTLSRLRVRPVVTG